MFQKCLDLPAEEREAFLESACGKDAALRDRVLRLLSVDERAGDFLESLPDEESKLVAEELQRIAPAEEVAGDQIGRYRLVELIGQGAHGSVWLAEQTEDIKRRVALKILKLGMDTKEFLTRFEVEKQVLAHLDHPNIAKVFDAGVTDFGRPFFVMELVEGSQVVTFANANRLGPRDRVELVLKLCQALFYAHRKGVIHRDLKPNNILVFREDGIAVPKVIDFGIAKPTNGRFLERTLLTGMNTFLGTPVYSSPEQLGITGGGVDSRSDIYSVGCLLYELLCGHPPFYFKGAGTEDLDTFRRLVRDRDAPHPFRKFKSLSDKEKEEVSERAGLTRSSLGKAIKGDLARVVLRCLEKDPERRYQTMSDLAADLEAHLKGAPVSAVGPSLSYRIHKFMTRPRSVYVKGLEACLLLLGIVALYLTFQSAERNGEEAHKSSPDEWTLSEDNKANSYFIEAQSAETERERLVLYREAVGEDPDFSEAWVEVALLSLLQWNREGRQTDSEYFALIQEAIANVERLKPRSAVLFELKSSYEDIVEGDYEASIRFLLQARKEGSKDTAIPLMAKYHQIGRVEESELFLEQAFTEDPDDPRLNWLMLNMFERDGDWDRADALVQHNLAATRGDQSRWTDTKSGTHVYWQYRAARLTYFQTKDLTRWIRDNQEIVGFSESGAGKLWIALVRRNLSEALEVLEKGFPGDSHPFKLTVLMGNSRDRPGFNTEPASLLKSLIWFEKGNQAKWQSEARVAKAAIQEAIDTEKEPDPNNLSLLALCLALEGNRESFESQLPDIRLLNQELRLQYRRQAECELKIACGYLVLGDHDTAIDILETAKEMHSRTDVSMEADLWFIFDRLRGNARFDALLARD